MYLKIGRLNVPGYFFIICIFCTLIFISGCSKDNNPTSSDNNPGTDEVLLQSFAFSPASKTIAVGTTIKWTNKDNTTHTVTSGSPGSATGLFDSGDLGQNGEFSFTFSQAGTFSYFCKYHSNMIGTIVVQ
jgi:plastocyanin